jgi:hypothetical protein
LSPALSDRREISSRGGMRVLDSVASSELAADPSAPCHLAAADATLLGLQSLSEYYRTRRYHAHWLREPASPLPWVMRFSRRAPPKVYPLAQSSRRVPFPYRASPGVPSLDCSKECSPEVLPPSAYRSAGPTFPGFASPGTLRLQVFSTSERVTSPQPPGLFSCRYRPWGFFPSELSPFAKPGYPFGASCLLAITIPLRKRLASRPSAGQRADSASTG